MASASSDLHVVASYGPSAASTRVRLNDWLRFLDIDARKSYYAGLRNNRPSSIVANSPAVALAEFALRRLDVNGQRVILSREASPFSQGGVEERLLRDSARGTYDFDDAIFDDPSPIRRILGTRDKCRRAVASADVVIAGNDYLANWAERHSKDVRVIPSCIEPSDYTPKTGWPITGDVPSLVWLGSHSTEHHVAQIAPALLEINRRTGAVLTLISSPTHNASLGLLNRMIRRVPWSLGSFASALARADAAIAPLSDSPYSRGKCAYKLLQYAATGLPMIGSPVGANELALRRFDGIVATTMDDWIHGLTQVVTESASRREARGAAGRTAVETHYSFRAWKSQWCDAVGITEANSWAPGV
jgi:glycosyltransferase involved in cell wall biosynthesis